MEKEMTKSKLLSAALVAAATLATPAMARTSHVTSRHLAADANPSVPLSPYYIDGPVGIRAPRVGAFASAPSAGEDCDVGDDERVC